MVKIKITSELNQSYTTQLPIDKALKQKEKWYAFELDLRLREWGVWTAKSLDNGLGFRAKSITISALEGSPGTAPVYPPDNIYAEEVNDAYLLLKVIHPDWASVLFAEYVQDKVERDKDCELKRSKKMETRAKSLSLPYGTYRRYLEYAKSFVEGRITR